MLDREARMRSLLSFPMAILIAVIASCAAGDATTGSMPLVTANSASPVEREILRRHLALAALNASIGDDALQFEESVPIQERLRAVVSARYRTDLSTIYGANLGPAEAEYLLLASTSTGYLCFVVRADDINAGGAYVDIPGLIYSFSREGHLLGVRASGY